MSLGKIMALAMLLGLVVGLAVNAAFGPRGRPVQAGMGTAFAAVVLAGLRQPPPPPRRRP